MNEPSEELIQRAAAGEEAALETLLGRHLPGLRAYVRLRAGPAIRAKESVSDIVQSVAREVLLDVGRFQYRGEAGFKRWLYTAALRKICDRDKYYRANKRDLARERPLAAEVGDEGVLGQYRSFYTPSQQAAAREELARVEEAFEQLPEQYQEVIVLAKIVGLSRQEIAEQMGRSEIAVRTLLSRALAHLSELME